MWIQIAHLSLYLASRCINFKHVCRIHWKILSSRKVGDVKIASCPIQDHNSLKYIQIGILPNLNTLSLIPSTSHFNSCTSIFSFNKSIQGFCHTGNLPLSSPASHTYPPPWMFPWKGVLHSWCYRPQGETIDGKGTHFNNKLVSCPTSQEMITTKVYTCTRMGKDWNYQRINHI